MKKVFFLSALFIGALSIMSFTANKSKNNMMDAIQAESVDASLMAAAAASFSETHSSYYDSDKNVWQKWHKTWTSLEPQKVAEITNVLAAY
ncbi:hypothetical protein [Gynurincola endophyticus]|jgi:hypothetical protein|uniref:hypothetical protein n=1 Tax=Gynurincola endophyticus TaxID=2479004 RepID=UPI000F8DAEE9|nr:hypothetical protein [Gynurincola endophyticus]